MKTLAQLLAEHPEWADLKLAVLDSVGELHYIAPPGDPDGSGLVFESDDNGSPILVLSAN